MFEQVTDRAATLKTGAVGILGAGGGYVLSVKAATELLQFATALIGFLIAAVTLWKMLKPRRQFRRKSPKENSVGPWIASCLILSLISGCAIGPKPQKGGRMRSNFGAVTNFVETVQPENPAGAATQNQTVTEERKMILPAKTEVFETRVTPSPSKGVPAVTNETRFVLSEPTAIETKIVREATSTVGGAQKDEARTLGVKQAALRPVMLAGIALLIAAGALAYFSHWLAAGIAGAIGLAMLVLFVTLPQHGLLIMGIGSAVAVTVIALLFLAYYKGKDANGNGVPDSIEKLTATVTTKAQ